MNKIFLVVALLAVIAGAFFSTKTLSLVEKNIADAKEAARPAGVKIVKITTPSCVDCFDIEKAISDFKKQNIKVEAEETLSFDSPEAISFIRQLGITRVPAYFVTGEVTKNNLESFVKNNGEIRDNTFIFKKVPPVFVDTESREEKGKVVATVLTDPSCPKCIDPKLTIESFKKAGIKIADQNEVFWNSYEGSRIINEYKITKIPTFILSSDIDLYENVKSSWTNLGTVEQDLTYVARNLFLPYRDLEKNQITGLVNLIYLTDSACPGCYQADQVQKPILTQGYGVALNSERVVDISTSEGQNLINRYNITKVPTVILSPDADQYTNLKNVWGNVGTVETDGWYIFREMQQLNGVIYKDLTTNQIVGQATPAPQGENK